MAVFIEEPEGKFNTAHIVRLSLCGKAGMCSAELTTGNIVEVYYDYDEEATMLIPAAAGLVATILSVKENIVHVRREHIVAWRVWRGGVDPVLINDTSDLLLIETPDGHFTETDGTLYETLDAAKAAALRRADTRQKLKAAKHQ